MHDPQIAQANRSDVDAFELRRCKDAHEVALWRYLTNTAPSGVWVARDADTLVAVGFAHENDDDWFLSELFVEGSFRGGGLATAMLKAVAGPAQDGTRSGIVDAADRGAIGLYASNGVALEVPLLRVSGEMPDERERARLASGDYRFSVEPLDAQRHRAALAALDRDVRGIARPPDHEWFCEQAAGTAVFLESEFVAYAYMWPNGTIGPLAAASAAYIRQVTAMALHNAAEQLGLSWVQLLVPGTNTRALRSLLRAGLRVTGTALYGSDIRNVDMSRYVGFHPWLF